MGRGSGCTLDHRGVLSAKISFGSEGLGDGQSRPVPLKVWHMPPCRIPQKSPVLLLDDPLPADASDAPSPPDRWLQ